MELNIGTNEKIYLKTEKEILKLSQILNSV